MDQLPWPACLRCDCEASRTLIARSPGSHQRTHRRSFEYNPVRPTGAQGQAADAAASPSEIAEKRLTKIRRKIEEWFDTEPVDDADGPPPHVRKAKANTEIEEYRMEVTPALANALGPTRTRALALGRSPQRCRPEPSTTTGRG